MSEELGLETREKQAQRSSASFSSKSKNTHHSSLVTHHSFHVTREGWCWLIFAAALWGVGLYKGVNLVTLLGTLMLAGWGLNIALAGRRLRRLQLRRWAEAPVFAQTPFRAWVEVSNPRRKAHLVMRLEDRGPKEAEARQPERNSFRSHGSTAEQRNEFRSTGRAWEQFVSRLNGGQRVQFCRQLVLPTRGRYVWEPVAAATGYPLGLAERRVNVGNTEELIVYPRLGRLHRGRLRRILAHVSPTLGRAQRRAIRHPAAQSDFHGLRAFRSGDSPHWIHWRTSARRGELMVREFEETPTDNLVLIVDPFRSPTTDSATRLEEAISLAATICWEWCRQTGDRFVLAVAGDDPVVIDGFTGRDLAMRLLECLALESGTSEPNYVKVVDRLQPVLPYAPILLVSTRPRGLEDDLERTLHQPIARLDVSNPRTMDFWEM
jgi:uncharacterized protein (DUF58 family)